MTDGKFREDLYYRLYVYPIVIPPLRERKEDLPVLFNHFLLKLNAEMGRRIEGISPQAQDVLANYSWPGNVRELRNVMERVMILCKGNQVEVGDLPTYLMEKTSKPLPSEWVDKLPEKFSLEDQIHQLESEVLLKTLKKCGYNKARAANFLGLTRSTFRYKLSRIPKELWYS